MNQQSFEISCQEVWREVSNYIDGDVSHEVRQRIEAHVQKCRRCFLLVDQMSSMVRLAANGTSFDLPSGFGERLRQRLAQAQRRQPCATGRFRSALLTKRSRWARM